ncbi:glucosyltransferase [Mycena olivaceomarginata]|nr:glucosyltransferase [Mycena olivaceomarginata]
MATAYTVFVGISISLLKEFNSVVSEPYMDEPFHIPQAQAYCRGEFDVWDPKITTPPGLYMLSLLLKKMFMLKCNVPMLRLTTMLPLLALPPVLTRLMCFHQRDRPSARILAPNLDAIVLSGFPIAWFFGFLYYTEVPSLLFVVGTVVAAMQNKHWFAALLGLMSCTFRQTNVIWVLYAYASSQLMYLRFRRTPPGAKPLNQLHDPPALSAGPGTAPKILGDILPAFVPYALVLVLFGAFVVWNGGIVLGDKSNHIPSLHIPQIYYFFAFSVAFGWPVLISGEGGALGLLGEVRSRIRILSTVLTCAIMAVTVNLFTIHHPFLLSDNRHYTFYIWHRIYMRLPGSLPPHSDLHCVRLGMVSSCAEQTILQTLVLPIFLLPTLLPTPLLEPRYFLIPYILLRSQVPKTPTWSLILEGGWYAAINAATMWVFLYMPREGVGRFMW